MINKVLALLLLSCLSQGQAFTTTTSITARTLSSAFAPPTALHSDPNSGELQFLEQQQLDNNDEEDLMPEFLLPRKRGVRGFFYNRFAGFVSGLVGFVTQGIAVDDYEYAELPPP
jgi:hypothetical protein